MFLDDIIEKKIKYLARAMADVPVPEMERRARTQARAPLDFYAALRADGLSVIAEIKKASPSKGLIRPDFRPADIARDYLAAGVQAMSVLTETDFFQGDPADLAAVRAIAEVPLLRKDFVLDPYQIYEARALGADAVLLIAAILSDTQLMEYRSLAHGLGMHCLAEVHNEAELRRVLSCGFAIIGINNRNLTTFREDLETTEQLACLVPPGKAIVSESGLRTAEDVARVRRAGADAVLIGETFMRAADIPAAVHALCGAEREGGHDAD